MNSFTWLQAVPALFTAVLCLLVPGVIILLSVRFSWLARFALSGPVSLALIGTVGVIGGLIHWPFRWWHVIVGAVICSLVTYWLTRRRQLSEESSQPRVRSSMKLSWPNLLLGLTWVVSSVVMAVILFHHVPSPAFFSQTYDNLFHLNATQSILETGNASSLQLRTLVNTGKTFSAYPAGWHSTAAMICQMTGVSVPVAFNALAIAVNAVLWLPGLAWLTAVLAPEARRRTAVAGAFLLGSASGFFPYALLVWGVLYPTYLAYAMFPSGLALIILLCRFWFPCAMHLDDSHDDGQELAVSQWAAVALVLVWWVGAFFTHPRSLVSIVLLLFPLACMIAFRTLFAAWRAGGRRRIHAVLWCGGVIVVGIAIATTAVFVVFRVFHVAQRPVSEHLNGPQAQAVQSVWDGIMQIMTQSALTGVGAESSGPLWVLSIVVLCSLGFGLSQRSLRWLPFTYFLVALLFALAAGSNSDLTKILTGLWYKDRYRLSALLPLIAVPLVSLMLAHLTSRIRNRAVPILLIGVIAVASWAALAPAWGSAAAREYRLAQQKGTDFVDIPQITFMQHALEVVPSGQRVLGDPWDGSALSWLYGAREPVFPHLTGQWDADRLLIANELPNIRENHEVCRALDRLNVQYVLASSGALDGGDPSGNRFGGIHAAVDAGLFTPVVSDGTSTLYRIDQCE